MLLKTNINLPEDKKELKEYLKFLIYGLKGVYSSILIKLVSVMI